MHRHQMDAKRLSPGGNILSRKIERGNTNLGLEPIPRMTFDCCGSDLPKMKTNMPKNGRLELREHHFPILSISFHSLTDLRLVEQSRRRSRLSTRELAKMDQTLSPFCAPNFHQIPIKFIVPKTSIWMPLSARRCLWQLKFHWVAEWNCLPGTSIKAQIGPVINERKNDASFAASRELTLATTHIVDVSRFQKSHTIAEKVLRSVKSCVCTYHRRRRNGTFLQFRNRTTAS